MRTINEFQLVNEESILHFIRVKMQHNVVPFHIFGLGMGRNLGGHISVSDGCRISLGVVKYILMDK